MGYFTLTLQTKRVPHFWATVSQHMSSGTHKNCAGLTANVPSSCPLPGRQSARSKDLIPDPNMDALLSKSLSALSSSNFCSSPPPLSPFLALPGEIRNKIYRYALVAPKPYAVKLQFAPLDTALLRVNKQIFSEASTIFYHESTFRIPEALFVGAPILRQLEGFYRVDGARLRALRRLVLDVPVGTLVLTFVLAARLLASMVCWGWRSLPTCFV